MSSLVGYTMAPSQKFMHILDNGFKETIVANIIYQNQAGKVYDEVYLVKTDATSKLLWIGSSDTDKTRKLLKNSVEAIIKNLK